MIIQEYEWYWSIIFNNYYVYVCITRRGVTCPLLMETFEIKVWAEGSDHPEKTVVYVNLGCKNEKCLPLLAS